MLSRKLLPFSKTQVRFVYLAYSLYPTLQVLNILLSSSSILIIADSLTLTKTKMLHTKKLKKHPGGGYKPKKVKKYWNAFMIFEVLIKKNDLLSQHICKQKGDKREREGNRKGTKKWNILLHCNKYFSMIIFNERWMDYFLCAVTHGNR